MPMLSQGGGQKGQAGGGARHYRTNNKESRKNSYENFCIFKFSYEMLSKLIIKLPHDKNIDLYIVSID